MSYYSLSLMKCRDDVFSIHNILVLTQLMVCGRFYPLMEDGVGLKSPDILQSYKSLSPNFI